MNIHNTLFEKYDLESTINDLLNGATKNWIGTKFERYPMLSSKSKGKFGEIYVEAYMKEVCGSTVCKPTCTDHDRIIDDYRTEIKFGLATSPKASDYNIKINSFTFNHIACHKQWDRLIFCGINPSIQNENIECGDLKTWDEINMYFMDKSDFLKHMKKDSPIFRPQQGGKKGDNDDYMVSGHRKFEALIKLPFVKPISQWR